MKKALLLGLFLLACFGSHASLTLAQKAPDEEPTDVECECGEDEEGECIPCPEESK